MKVFKNKNCWIIEDYLDAILVKEIKTIIQENLDLDNLYVCGKGYSASGRNTKQYWLILQQNDIFINDSRFYEFEKKYRDQILNRIRTANLFDENKKDHINLKPSNCWSVIGKENSYHTMHFHNERNYDGISTIVYLNVPETNIENEPENNVFLVTDLGQKNPFYDENLPCLSINPEVGKILIFPDWVLHGTYPQTKGIRQTFNIDYKLIFDYNKNLLKKILY